MSKREIDSKDISQGTRNSFGIGSPLFYAFETDTPPGPEPPLPPLLAFSIPRPTRSSTCTALHPNTKPCTHLFSISQTDDGSGDMDADRTEGRSPAVGDLTVMLEFALMHGVCRTQHLTAMDYND